MIAGATASIQVLSALQLNVPFHRHVVPKGDFPSVLSPCVNAPYSDAYCWVVLRLDADCSDTPRSDESRLDD